MADESANGLVDSPETPIHLNDTNFDAAAAKYGFLVIDLWAPWCMPCRLMEPVVESLAGRMKGTVAFAKVNVDESPGVASRYGIMSIPTVLFFKNGEKVDEMVGAVPEAILEQKIQSLL